MKLSLSTLALIAAAAALATPAHAQNYPWCAIYSGGAVGGGTNCGFVSYEQCMATARGLGSFVTGTRNTCRRRGRIRSGGILRIEQSGTERKRHSGRLGPRLFRLGRAALRLLKLSSVELPDQCGRVALRAEEFRAREKFVVRGCRLRTAGLSGRRERWRGEF